MTDRSVTKHLVTVEVTNYAVPQLIAPKGRWNYHLRGRGFEVRPTGGLPTYSPESAASAGKRLATRFGFVVRKVNVETDYVR